MPTETCILTTKDFTILEVMRDRCLGQSDPIAPILKRKLDSAVVVFRDDIPANVATLNSRVTFRVDGRASETRILAYECTHGPTGVFLPITTPRALALLGLSEGQAFLLTDPQGREERVLLEKVHYQPEAARRDRERSSALTARARGGPSLKLVRGGLDSEPRLVPAGPTDFDDPGPSAA